MHTWDVRSYFCVVGETHFKALQLVDLKQFSYLGNDFYQDFHLGPLANILSAIPLLVSRNIYLSYYFLHILMLLGVVFFYFACHRLLPAGIFKWAATILFAFTTLTTYTPLRVVNTTYMPFFLGLYFYILVRYNQSKYWFTLIVLWLIVGLLLQLNFSCFLLIPPTLIATQGYINSKQRILSTIGLLLITVLHYHLAGELMVNLYLKPNVDLFNGSDLLSFLLSYLKFLPLCLMANFNFIILILLIPAIINLSKIMTNHPEIKPLIIGGIVAIALGIIFPPIFCVFKEGLRDKYSNYAVVFWFLIIGLYIHDKSLTTEFGIYLFFIILSPFLFFWGKINIPEYYSVMQLNTQVAISKRLISHIRKEKLNNYVIEEYIYLYKDGSKYLANRSESTYNAMIWYQWPVWRPQLIYQPLTKILVVVSLLNMDVHIYKKPYDEFITGKFKVRCYQLFY